MKYLIWLLLVCPLFAQRPVPPSHIKIGMFHYTLKMVKGDFSCGAVKKAIGCEDSETLEITIKKDMALEAEQEVVWHEVKHAVDKTFILTGEGEEFSDENWVEHSSPGELEVMRENPELVAYLVATENQQPNFGIFNLNVAVPNIFCTNLDCKQEN